LNAIFRFVSLNNLVIFLPVFTISLIAIILLCLQYLFIFKMCPVLFSLYYIHMFSINTLIAETNHLFKMLIILCHNFKLNARASDEDQEKSKKLKSIITSNI
jgi:hypothetical protein